MAEGIPDGSLDTSNTNKDLPCGECRALDCHSIHGHLVPECPLQQCIVCGDLAKIDLQISGIYKHLSDLVKKRQQISAQGHYESIIHRLPIEILSLIFGLVNVKEVPKAPHGPRNSQDGVPKPSYRQPSQSPPLLVGAICRKWRELTLSTPWLWTDLIINLDKQPDGQFNMVQTWARRSGVLPIDITIFTDYRHPEDEEEILENFVNMLSALRSLADRWNDIALNVPGSFCHRLLNNMQEATLINTLCLNDMYGDIPLPVSLRYPLRPRRMMFSYDQQVPIEWDRLVFAELPYIDSGLILHIIRHAQNLRHLIVGGPDAFEEPNFPVPVGPITNHSLIYLHTNCNIFGHLTLPSLQHLDFAPTDYSNDDSFDSLVQFVDRSRAPLHEFILGWYLPRGRPFPSFEKLPGITSIYLNIDDDGLGPTPSPIDDFLAALIRSSPPPVLPRLHTLSLELDALSASSWSLFSRLFPKDTNSTETEPITNRPRKLSRAVVTHQNEAVAIDKDAFVRLLGVKKSGVDLIFTVNGYLDLFEQMAGMYDVEL